MNTLKKFGFGRWKTEKEPEPNNNNSGGLFHFHHEKRHSRGDLNESDDTFSDRKKTIVRSPSSVAPVRLSSEAASSSSTFLNGDDDVSTGRDVHSRTMSTTSATEMSNKDIDGTAGIMTIKVYNGEGFILPVSITSNETILSRLLSSGINSAHVNLSNEVDALILSLIHI